jgi:ATP/ADP translocase
MFALLFFLIAANNIIKVVRDSIFLSQHAAAELPYVYLYSGFLAGLSIAFYGRYASRISLDRLMMGSLAFITLGVLFFWYLLEFHDAGWVHYAFYIWASIVVMVAVAQFWTFAEELFTAREGKRLFGTLTTGGTLGGILGAFGARWAMSLHLETIELLWLVAVLLVCALGICRLATGQPGRSVGSPKDVHAPDAALPSTDGIIKLMRKSPYLAAVGALIFVSVIVSTLIDFQFKVAAKEVYVTGDSLSEFFASYYGWLNVITLFAQLALTGQLLALIGLYPSLFFLPVGLLFGSLALLVHPGLLTATGTRLGDAALRPSIHRGVMEMLYFPVPSAVKTRIRPFLDVGVERLGDGTAGFIILFFFLTSTPGFTALVYFCIALIIAWLALLPFLRRGYLEALLSALKTREVAIEADDVTYEDKAIVDAVAKILESPDEQSLLFGLELAERLDSGAMLSRLPRSLLRHPSPVVQSRILKFLSTCTDCGGVDDYLFKSLKQDRSLPAIRQALAAAEKRQDLQPIKNVIFELDSRATKGRARQALVAHGESAVRPLRDALFDSLISPAVRLHIPRTLSKIGSQSAMDALLGALEHGDGAIRYRVFLGLEEMARRFPDLRLDRGAIENAVVSDAKRYYKRFVIFFVLFSEWQETDIEGSWLLRRALLDSLERVKERVVYLLSLIYPPAVISRALAVLRSGDPVKRAYATELLDNFLTGKIKRFLFPLFEDAPEARQFQKFLALLGWKSFNSHAALEELLQQEDVWLRAATIWEIGLRGLVGFEEKLQSFRTSEDAILKETAELVLSGVAFGHQNEEAYDDRKGHPS